MPLSISFRSLRNTVWLMDLLVHQNHWEMASVVPSITVYLVLKLVVNSSQKISIDSEMDLLIREVNLVAFSHNLFVISPMLFSKMKFELRKSSSVPFHIFWNYSRHWYILGARLFKSRIKNDFSGIREAPVNHPKTSGRDKCDFPGIITTTTITSNYCSHARQSIGVPCSKQKHGV